MKLNKSILIALLIASSFVSFAKKKKKDSKKEEPSTNISLTTVKDSLSYALAVNIASSFKQGKLDTLLQLSVFNKGIATVLDTSSSASDLLMSPEASGAFLQSYFQKVQEQQAQAQFGEKIAQEKKFFAENKTKEGVVETASGLQYQILKEGTGLKPTGQDQVTVHYTGTLVDGTVFDSSVERGEPATFGVGQVIKGWTEALQLMQEGAKWKLFIPSNLGYGASGAGQSIPPYSTLIFEVELLGIQ